MSFVGKAVKKVFNFHKKIHSKIKKAWKKKWVRGVVIAALAVFAVGLGSGGFKNWSTWSSQGGGKLAGFFNAVGKTFATGFSTIWRGVGTAWRGMTGQGAVGQYGDGRYATETQFRNEISGDWDQIMQQEGAGQLANTGRIGTALAGRNGSANAGGGGWASRFFGSIFGTNASSTNSNAGTFWRNAIIGGFSYWSKKQEMDEEYKRRDNATVYGGPAFGGDEEVPEGYIRSPLSNKGKPGESVASSIAFGSSDAGKIKTRPLYNPSDKKYQAPLLGKATQLSDLPAIEALLDPSKAEPLYG